MQACEVHETAMQPKFQVRRELRNKRRFSPAILAVTGLIAWVVTIYLLHVWSLVSSTRLPSAEHQVKSSEMCASHLHSCTQVLRLHGLALALVHITVGLILLAAILCSYYVALSAEYDKGLQVGHFLRAGAFLLALLRKALTNEVCRLNTWEMLLSFAASVRCGGNQVHTTAAGAIGMFPFPINEGLWAASRQASLGLLVRMPVTKHTKPLWHWLGKKEQLNSRAVHGFRKHPTSL